MRAVFNRAQRRRSREQIDNQVKVRLIRQERLTSTEDPLELVVVLDEGAIRRQVGAIGVLPAQLRYLIKMAELPAVTVQLLPFEVGVHGALTGAFTILDFPEPELPALLYHSYVTANLHIEGRAEVQAAKLVFDSLRREALSPADSVALLEQLA